MKVKISIIITLFFSINFFSQKVKDTVFHYVISDKSDKLIYSGIESEFYSKRTYINNSQYNENVLGIEIFIKKFDSVWYFYQNKKSHLFYDFKKRKGGIMKIKNKLCRIDFHKIISLRNYKFHKISIRPIKKQQTHIGYYYLDYENGVIIIFTSIGKYLIRDGFLERPLTTFEEDSLSE